MNKITKICQICNNTYLSYKYIRSKYCSHKCMGLDRKNKRSKKYKRISLICKNCGQEFLVQPYLKNRQYCSKSCSAKYRNKMSTVYIQNIFCKDCSKKLEVYGKRKLTIQRCRKCYILSRTNNKTTTQYKFRKTSTYNKWRNSIYYRDHYTCALCNDTGCKLNVHHIRKFSIYKNLRLNRKNGITLCERCHQKYVNRHEEEYQDYFDILILSK